MTCKLIRKQDLPAFLKSLQSAHVEFFAPLGKNDEIDFSRVEKADDIVFDHRNTVLPPKRFLRPACQETGVIEKDELVEAEADFPATVIFGVRPCDAASFTRLDKVLLEGEYADEFYKARRDATTVVALACDSVGENCFCTALGSGPASSAGADVLAFDLGKNLLLETHSPKGEALLSEHASCFAEPGKGDLSDREKRGADAAKVAAGAALPGKEKLLAAFHSPAWERVSETCLGCNVCAYVCPTCHCFALADEKRGGRGRRLRVEDSCLNRNFTAEASGHNPRPTARERMRQRIMHKFAYAEDLYGEPLCVGCGRCIENCPVKIDIRETLSGVCQ